MENLAVPSMVRNHKLAKSISDAGWGQLCTMLKSKSQWEGTTYIEVDRFFPSSKTCSNCLHQVDNLSLDIRGWQCPKCQTLHDRDINAAINIRDVRKTLPKAKFTTSGGRASRYCFWTTCKTI